MNSEKHYHEEYNINYNSNLFSNWQYNTPAENMMSNYIAPQDDLEFLFNSRYSDVEQYQVLQQSDSANFNQIQYNDNNENVLNIMEDNKWNAEDDAEFQSSEKQQIQEDQEQNLLVSYQGSKLRSQQTLNKQYSNRSHSVSSECSARDNSSSQEKSSSSNKSYSNEESFSHHSESISNQRKKNFSQNEDSSNNESNRAKNKQSQHKNVVKNIGLGFKNYLIDSKSPLNSKIQEILKENRLTHFEFRQWINQSVKLDQKKEIYKALNIKQDDNQKIQNFKRILSNLFSIFFEQQYASAYLWKNQNIQNKDIHIQFIKHFIQSSRDTDYLLKKWK